MDFIPKQSSYPFKIYSPLTQKSVDDFKYKMDEDRLVLEGIASTTSKDLQNEIVSKEAIKSMKEQALGVNIHADHSYNLGSTIGTVIGVEDTSDDKFKIKFKIRKKFSEDIKDMLDTGIKLGLSIGGIVDKVGRATKVIKSIDLKEITLTPMPANFDTFGSVITSKGIIESNCLSGACYMIQKKYEADNMVENKMNGNNEDFTESFTKDDAIGLFNELMAEKEATIVDEMVSRTESSVAKIVEEKLNEFKSAASVSSGQEEKTENKKEEEDTDKKKDEEDENEESSEETKSKKELDPMDIRNMVSEEISKALSSFGDDLASKMFSDLDRKRDVKGSKLQKFLEQRSENTDNEEPASENIQTINSRKCAEILMQKNQSINPIANLAMENITKK